MVLENKLPRRNDESAGDHLAKLGLMSGRRLNFESAGARAFAAAPSLVQSPQL